MALSDFSMLAGEEILKCLCTCVQFQSFRITRGELNRIVALWFKIHFDFECNQQRKEFANNTPLLLGLCTTYINCTLRRLLLWETASFCSAQKEEHWEEKIKLPQLQRTGTAGKCEVMSNDFIGKTEFHISWCKVPLKCKRVLKSFRLISALGYTLCKNYFLVLLQFVLSFCITKVISISVRWVWVTSINDASSLLLQIDNKYTKKTYKNCALNWLIMMF